MRVLTFLHYYLPGYKSGGPVRTLENMVAKLPGLDFHVVTSDRDLGDKQRYEGVECGRPCKRGGALISYLDRGAGAPGIFKSIVKILRREQYDLIYVNSYFDILYSFFPLLVRRFFLARDVQAIVAPRGEFSQGALELKRTKKRAYIAVAKLLGVHADVVWQASSKDEQRDIERVLGARAAARARIVVAPDIAATAPKLLGIDKTRDFEIVFLSRISPKKNLLFALTCLKQVRCPVVFNIYGPVEDEAYWKRCKDVIQELPSHVVVKFHGTVRPDQVYELLARHHLFFFPTLGENYGHVIIESLAAGTPVLLSDQSPWRSDEAGACSAIPLSQEQDFASRIEEFAQMPEGERLALSQAAQRLSAVFSDEEQTVARNYGLFRYALNGRHEDNAAGRADECV
ncbi:glycosyltransferase family 4 protein [Massilia varians]